MKNPAIRIDGSKRTNLAAAEQRRLAARVAKDSAPPTEATRVSDAWERDRLRTVANDRLSVEDRQIRQIAEKGGLKEGTEVSVVEIKISDTRYDTQAIRARPGTFEWRYGRDKQDALFHAGSHLAILWERAGIAVASSADFLRGTRAGFITGMADGRIAAIDKLKGFVETMGFVPANRLIDYCVVGLTTAQIARKHGSKERDMAAVLNEDLRVCAFHFRFLGKS